MELSQIIEAILFSQAEPMAIKRLSVLLKRTEVDIESALSTLKTTLENHSGLRLLWNNDEVVLGTAPEASTILEEITKEELSKDLSKASIETLAIVLYKGPITRSEIDYIRGVNSTFILRNLLIRGLVEKVENPQDQRSFLYKTTFALLEYMGVTNTQDLPEYADTLKTLATFSAAKQEETKGDVNVVAGDDTETAHAIKENLDMEESEVDVELEADIIEEDSAGTNFDDEELREHQNKQPDA